MSTANLLQQPYFLIIIYSVILSFYHYTTDMLLLYCALRRKHIPEKFGLQRLQWLAFLVIQITGPGTGNVKFEIYYSMIDQVLKGFHHS